MTTNIIIVSAIGRLLTQINLPYTKNFIASTIVAEIMKVIYLSFSIMFVFNVDYF